jgi:hypothetical protein
MNPNLQIELKVYGLYSSVAEEVGCRVNDVDKVYTWYTEQINKALRDPKTVQIYLKGMGALRANPACITNAMYSRIARAMHIAGFMVNVPKHHTLRKYEVLNREYLRFEKAYTEGMEKMEILMQLDVYNTPLYEKQRQRLLSFKETHLNKLYESVQRIYESYQKGCAECGQDSGGTQQQSLEAIQFTK